MGILSPKNKVESLPEKRNSSVFILGDKSGSPVSVNLEQDPGILLTGKNQIKLDNFLFSIIKSSLVNQSDILFIPYVKNELFSQKLKSLIWKSEIIEKENIFINRLIGESDVSISYLKEQISFIYDEILNRQKIFSAMKCRNISEYEEMHQLTMSRIIFISDIFHEIFTNIEESTDYTDKLRSITRIGRSYGVSFMGTHYEPFHYSSIDSRFKTAFSIILEDDDSLKDDELREWDSIQKIIKRKDYNEYQLIMPSILKDIN